MMRSYQEYQKDVLALGIFQGEMPYVPYYWDQYLDGGADEEDGEYLVFDVTDEERALFPELADLAQVRLYQNNEGFVCEVLG